MNSDVLIGYRKVADGAIVTLRGDRTGALLTTDAHTNYVDPVGRGAVMVVSNAVAGVAPGTAFSTTPPLALWNPPSSGKNLAIFKTALGYVSGTLGAGTICYGIMASQTTVPTTGTELVPNNALIGFPRGVGRAFTGSTWSAAPTIYRPAYTLGAFLATTASVQSPLVDIIDGGIILTPGTGFAMQGIAAAGTSPLVIMSIAWEELDI